MERIHTHHKNCLQEYCQDHNLPLPIYQIKKESGPPHIRQFQVKVRVNGRWYVGCDYCSSKKKAEQSAAANAWNSLVDDKPRLKVKLEPQSPLPISSIKCEQLKHFPKKYADIERFIADKVEAFNGQIESIRSADIRGRYRVEVTGSYRYCKNVRRHHKNDSIYFLVNPVKRIYYQKCYHRKCLGFRSAMKIIPIDSKSHRQCSNKR